MADNPVLWREIRRPLFARPWQSIAAAILVVGTLLVVYIITAWTGSWRSTSLLMEPFVHAAFGVVFCGLLTVVVCVVSATAISHETLSRSHVVA